MANIIHERLTEFLRVADQFRLGNLVTEGPHHLTGELSKWAAQNLPRGLQALRDVDTLALGALDREIQGIWRLHLAIKETLAAGGDVLLVGCGATGRLSLVLETLSRQMGRYPERIRAFMAGGDYALIKSVESFEDRTDYGSRELYGMGFKDGDLLLAITEGGETPFVIGACLEAARVSRTRPWFLYCNPDGVLEKLQRCREVLGDPKIEKLNLTCGAMALTGSTRMQASTVQMAAVGFALLYDWTDQNTLQARVNAWCEWQSQVSWDGLLPLIEWEAMTHAADTPVTYLSDPRLAISILTDTTERSPTFSQPPFENVDQGDPMGPIYLALTNARTSQEAWQNLLGRAPRCLVWPDVVARIGPQALIGFDISMQAIKRRGGEVLSFHHSPGRVVWQNDHHTFSQPVWDSHPLTTHLSLKMALNALSTLMMGRRGFYLDNVMTWVKPSNNKLIDRATRYVQLLAKRRGVDVPYEKGVELVMTEMVLGREGAVVLHVLTTLGVGLS